MAFSEVLEGRGADFVLYGSLHVCISWSYLINCIVGTKRMGPTTGMEEYLRELASIDIANRDIAVSTVTDVCFRKMFEYVVILIEDSKY
jgi:hypothetical protein